MISLGKLFSKKNTSKIVHIQCCHCGGWFNTGVGNIRAMNYCPYCLD